MITLMGIIAPDTLAAPDWAHCGHGAEPGTEPIGCRGHRVEPFAACLDHLDSTELSVYLGTLAPGAEVDHRGTRLSRARLADLLTRLTDPATSRPRLSRARFDGATFEGHADFRRATFEDGATFDGATFTGDAGLHGTLFTGDAGFRRVTFGGNAWFGGATFEGGAEFGKARFTALAWFSGVEYGGDVGFGGVSFDGDTWFAGVPLTGNVRAASRAAAISDQADDTYGTLGMTILP